MSKHTQLDGPPMRVNKETQTDPPLPPPPPLPLPFHTTQNFFILPATDVQYTYEEQEEDDRECDCDDDYEEEYDEDDPEYFPEEEEEDPKASLKRCYTKDDIKYYDKLNKRQKTKIDKTESEIKKLDFFTTPMRFRILESAIDPKLKQLAIQKVDELSMMYQNGEYFKLKNWVESMCRLPIGVYKNLPVTKEDPIDKISSFMEKTRSKFDELVYGHVDAKEQIIKLLAKWISNPRSHGIVIGIQGPAGSGKTTLGMALCQVLSLPFGFVSLAGINGEPFFTGHSYCYEGSRCGRIADILMSSQCMNPILYFDELDKISTTSHGEEVANFLVHLTDFSQNHKFQDKYFGDIDLDLSKCIIIFSYNHEELINPILKDRMITIRTNGYNVDDKVKLSQEFLLPRALNEFGFKPTEIEFPEETIKYIIEKIDDEKGARNLNRAFEEIVGTVNFKRLLGEEKDFPMKVTTKLVDKHLVIGKKVKDSTSAQMMYL